MIREDSKKLSLFIEWEKGHFHFLKWPFPHSRFGHFRWSNVKPLFNSNIPPISTPQPIPILNIYRHTYYCVGSVMHFVVGSETVFNNATAISDGILNSFSSKKNSKEIFLNSNLVPGVFRALPALAKSHNSRQTGIKCVSVAAALRAEQGPWGPTKDCIRKIREH